MPVYSSHLTTYHDLKLGKRIRKARQEQALTLQELAARSGMSPGRLSQIETEEHVLDLRQALSIARALNVPLDSLLPSDRIVPYQITREGHVERHPPRDAQVLDPDGARPMRNLFWPLADMFVGRQMEPALARIMPADDDELLVSYHHDQEFVFVLKGTIEFAIAAPAGRRREELGPGDCIYFRPNLPHRLRSLRPDPSETLHVFSSATPHPTPLTWVSASANGDDPPSVPVSHIGPEFTFFRCARGWTIKSTAELVGLSERQVREIEEGKRGIRFDAVLNFARAFGRPLREFTRIGPQPEPYYFIQRAAHIDRVPTGQRRHRLQRPGSPPISFEYLPLARGFPARYIYPYLLRVPNVGIESLTTHEHHGQELIYVLDGQIEMTSFTEDAEVKETLQPGDSCYHDASVPHLVRGQSRNPYSETSASIIVVFWCPLGQQYLFDMPASTEPQGGSAD